MGRAFAFDRVVVEGGCSVSDRGDEAYLRLPGVTFRVREWFSGGRDATVTVDIQPPTTGSAEPPNGSVATTTLKPRRRGVTPSHLPDGCETPSIRHVRGSRHERTSRGRSRADLPGAAIDSSCRAPIMNPMEDKQAPQSAEGDAKVITLCGSTKFEAEFAEVNQRLTMEGCVVMSLGMFSLPDLPEYDWTADSSDLKERLGSMHFQKIRMADEVYIVDPDGYVGESTRREIAYAESLGKPVRYLSHERLARTADGPMSESDPAVRSSARPLRGR
jgi:hypothetical protein